MSSTDDPDLEPASWAHEMLGRAKRFGIIGAVMLWVASPLLIGGWITVAVRASNAGGVTGGVYALLAVWAVACLLVLLLGFAFLLGGVFLWWRSRSRPASAPRRVGDAAQRDAARRAVLLQLQDDLRAERLDSSAMDDHSAERDARR